jgi:soluble lytic murein transglycosylase
MRLTVLFAALCLATPTHAQNVAAAMHADRWDEAMADAASIPDPLAQKLVTYYRLLTPNIGSARALDGFITANPDWPQQELLARRRDEALAREADDTIAVDLCAHTHPALATALRRCADAYAQIGQQDPSINAARSAWIGGLATPAAELTFLQRWSSVLRPQDQAQRFDVLAWTDPTSAARQILRLDVVDRPAAEARLALRRDDPTATVLFAKLTPAQQTEPGVFLERVRNLRRTGHDADALALWLAVGPGSEAAERSASPTHLAAFWAERNLLARRLLRSGDVAGAYALASSGAEQAPEQLADAAFLAGFIALEFRHDTAAATDHFQALRAASKAIITQARAHYWLGRAAAARGDGATQHAEFAAAAAWPTTYYGQLAAQADGAKPPMPRDPEWTDAQAVDFAGQELTRAASILVGWGEPRRAHAFLLRLTEQAPDAAHRALAARLATLLGMPDIAVAIARRAGRDGVMLPQTGWPTPFAVPDGPVPAALTLGVMRQESSFDPGVVSPAGARGLMQLMPGTAALVGKKRGLTPNLPALTTEPALNILLGSSYLGELLDQFAGSVPLAVAAYNAGPGRVREWLATNGDPRTQPTAGSNPGVSPGSSTAPIDMVDWIELIPFDETRNYVQRVSENMAIYSQRDATALTLAAWQRVLPTGILGEISRP